jgi:hypothetical protein
MIIGADKVEEYIKIVDAKHMRIYQGNNRRTPVYAYEMAGGNPACINAFRQWAAINNSTQCVEYYITLYPKGKPTGVKETPEGETAGNVKDTLISQFYLVAPAGFQAPGQTQSPAVMGAYPGSYPGETMEAMIKRIRDDIEKEYEIEDLEEENAALKQEQTAFYANLNKIMGLAGPVLEALGGKPATGIPTARALGEVSDTIPAGAVRKLDTDTPRLNKALQILREKDPDIVKHLEQLAQIAIDKPATFNQLITMLGAM